MKGNYWTVDSNSRKMQISFCTNEMLRIVRKYVDKKVELRDTEIKAEIS